MNPWPDLRPILGDIPWAVVGGRTINVRGVVTRAYMPERATKDLDILVRSQGGDEVIERLEAAGYQRISPLTLPGFLLRSPEGIELDVIFGDYDWLDEALADVRRDPAGYPVLDLPYLILMKMASSRGRDIGDLTTMLGLASQEEVTRVREVVARYTPEEAGDLESLIYLGRIEMGEEPPPEA